MNDNFAIMLLAAGSSSRMGQSKQLLDVGGESLLQKSTRVAIESGIRTIVVVLGANEKEHRSLLSALPINIVYNGTWEKGMGNSLKAGLNYLIQLNPTLTGVVAMVCDQPLLKSQHINRLTEFHLKTGKPIIASGYANSAGVPAFFERKYFHELSNLEDSQGAKKIIMQHPEDTFVVPFPGGEIDLDTEKDYQSFKQKKNQT